MTDTTLSALPATGGIGTTIFTVLGCLIMIAAAGMYFASRRKSTKE
jgi:LPXTG-motif cell wall-anchored protein